MLSVRTIKTRVGHVGQTCAIAFLLLAAVNPTTATAAATDELFADGNRLFHDNLYWAALLRYRQAADAGMDTPILHYNMGVAHFKAHQYTRARTSLIIAARSTRLRAISYYNLGLNARTAGDKTGALSWFEKASEQQQSAKIRALARSAIERIRLERKKESLVATLVRQDQEEKSIIDFELRTRIGGSTDSNVFRSPGKPYVDLSRSPGPLVKPDIQQGFFIPVNILAKYSINSFEHESFFGSYRFTGRFYQDKALSNANELRHELSFGSEYLRREGSRMRRIFSAFSVARNDEVYFDRDTGSSRTSGGIDISDRFNYLRYGPQISFRQSSERFAIGARGKAQLWNYDDTVAASEYDHEYFLVGLSAQYRVTSSTLLRLTADGYKRKFGERLSTNLDGTNPIGNPAVEYDYLELGITARQRVARSLWFGIDYARTDRKDRHVGYNDFVKDSYSAEVHFRVGNRFDLEASASFQNYDYTNAFAFQNPSAGRKTLERTLWGARATFDITRHLTLVAEYRFEDVRSNDPRITYDRNRIGASIRWSN